MVEKPRFSGSGMVIANFESEESPNTLKI